MGTNTSTKNSARKYMIIAELALACLTFGCASIGNESNQKIEVRTFAANREITGGDCTGENTYGKWTVSTPGILSVRRSAGQLTLFCSALEYEGTEVLDSLATGLFYGNLLLGGIPGMTVDGAGGSGFSYPPSVTIFMKPKQH